MWRDYYHLEYALEEGILFSRMRTADNKFFYNLPISRDEILTKDLYAHMKLSEDTIRFTTVPDYLLDQIRLSNSIVSVEEQSHFFDYVYDSVAMKSFSGKQYSGQRNHVNQYIRNSLSWSFDLMSEENIEEVKAFFLRDYMAGASHGSYEEEENKKTLEVIDNYIKYGMIGGALRLNGEIVGFTINEILDDTMFTHIEKADKRIRGAYQMLVQQAASSFTNNMIKYINREEDMGDEGLRASKESYHPIAKIKKYIVEVTR